MTSEKKTVSGIYEFLLHGAPRLRFALCLVALSAFIYQSFLIQTHIHGVTPALVAGNPPTNNDAPADEHHCLLCLDAVIASSLLTPPPVPLPVAPTVVEALLPPETHISVSSTPAHHWRGRAPPHRT